MLKKYVSRLMVVVMLVAGLMTPYKADIAVEAFYADEEDSNCVGIEVIDISDSGLTDASDETGTYDDGYVYATDTDADEELELYGLSELEEEEFHAGTGLEYIASKNFWIYGNSYLRNYLTADEKAFYDELDAACYLFLTTGMDATAKNYTSNGALKTAYVFYNGAFDVSSIGTDRATEIVTLFIYQNPQYYFISYKTLKDNKNGLFYLLCYDEFVNGEKRADITEQIFTQIDAWVDDINQKSNDYEKEKRADNIICANSIYLDDSSTPYTEFADRGWLGYGQSVYSLVVLGKSVCAGYTKTFEMLMNACGILTIGITSSNHAWNKIRLNGIWYNVDTTWNDGDGRRTSSSEVYLNKSDSYFINTNHTQSSVYDDVAPTCEYNFDSNEYYKNLYIPITGMSVDISGDIVLKKYEKGSDKIDISAVVTPYNATNRNCRFIVADKDIACYSAGTIYGLSAGETKLTIKTEDTVGGAPIVESRNIIVYDKYSAPTAPSIEDATATTVTLSKKDGCEYSKDKKTWQKSNVFTGLEYNTNYTFYARKAANGYYIESDASAGTVVKTEAITDATVSASGIYVFSTSPSVVAGCVTTKSDSNASLEYRWLAYSESDGTWSEISPWIRDNEYLSWTPEKYGNYVLLCYVRVVGNEAASLVTASTGVSVHPYIKGKCQMPYWGTGGGYLIGVESYDNPNQSYSYEMLILDCTLLAQNLPAWTYTTGKLHVSEGNAMWTIWQPLYGYYWTLFRVYDDKGNLIDEECYGFQNIY